MFHNTYIVKRARHFFDDIVRLVPAHLGTLYEGLLQKFADFYGFPGSKTTPKARSRSGVLHNGCYLGRLVIESISPTAVFILLISAIHA
jgi:hypothetical protein